MKRTGYIYEKVCDVENIKIAIMRSSLGKRDRPFVKSVLDNIDDYTERIHNMLLNKTYIPSPYTIKIIQDNSSNILFVNNLIQSQNFDNLTLTPWSLPTLAGGAFTTVDENYTGVIYVTSGSVKVSGSTLSKVTNVKGFVIKAPSGNTGTMYLVTTGCALTTGFPLAKSEQINFNGSSLAKLDYWGSVSGSLNWIKN